MELYVVQNQVGIEIAVANLEMLLPCDKGKSVAHLQQVSGDVLYQLFLYVPFVRVTCFTNCSSMSLSSARSLAPAKSKIYGSFNR